jgi:hypothetical protein
MSHAQPDATGHFGPYGGRFVPEVLMAPLEELEKAYLDARLDAAFQAELRGLLADYAGRPTPLYYAKRMTEALGGAKVYIKREDLLHTGAHKINNCLGQILVARRMGKRRIIAETGAGQHGVATASVCALFGLECVVYMGEEDMRRQRLNVFRMRLLGARVVSNAIGIFHAFLPTPLVELIGVEAGGRGDAVGDHAARFRGGAPGVLQGAYSYVLQDGDGQIALTHSVSAGLDYAMIGPEHAWLHDQKPRPIHRRFRRRSARRRAPALAHGGHHSGARIGARRRRGGQARPRRQREDLPGEPLRPRRQGHRYLPREFQGTGRAMTRIGRMFDGLKRDGRKGLIAYLTAGDPSPDRTPALVEALERGGADLIELGVPFSDPIADGPVIQRAGERALKAGTSLKTVLEIAAPDPPIRSSRCCCSPISTR